MEKGEGIRLMLKVYVNDVEQSATGIRLELSNRGPSSFQFTLPGIHPVALGDTVKIYRDSSHVFTGLVEEVRRQKDRNGLETAVSGRDLSAKLATRCVEDALLEGEPRDLLKAILRPSKKFWQAQRRADFSEEELWRWRCQDSSFGNKGEWSMQDDHYLCTIFGNIPDGYPGTGFTNQYNSTECDPLEDAYGGLLFSAEHTKDTTPTGEKPYIFWPGFFLRYQDDYNWLSVNLFLYAYKYNINPPYQPPLYKYGIQTGVEIRWCVDGAISSARSEVETIEGMGTDASPAGRYWPRSGHRFLLFGEVRGNQAKAWLEDLTDPRVWTLSATLPSDLASLGGTGLTIQFDTPNGLVYTHRFKFYYLFTAAASPLCSASKNNDLAGAAGLAAERIPWKSGSNQAQGDWFQVDLGASRQICRVKIVQDEVKYARNWKVERSPDGSNWTTIATATNYSSHVIDIPFEPVSARYIRATILATEAWHWHIHTFWVYLPDGPILAQFDDSSLDAYGDRIAARADGATALEIAQRIAQICGWKFWVDKDGKAWFKPRRGMDKSASVGFGLEGSPILGFSRELDYRRATNELYYEGHGKTPPDVRRLFVVEKDASSQGQHGILFRRRSGKDLVEMKSVALRAQRDLAEESTLAEEFAQT